MSGEQLLRIEKLSISFDKSAPRPVVNNVSFTLNSGQLVAIVGESGSGKSVTCRSILGLAGEKAHLSSEVFELQGQSVHHFSEQDWRKIRGKNVGLVLQDAMTSLDPLRAIGDEVREVLDIHQTGDRKSRISRVIESLTAAGFSQARQRAGQRPRMLSGGLRQRALIAAATAGKPSILIADEPTTALDATLQKKILGLLKTLATRGNGVLLVTHDLPLVAAVADYILVMKDGEIVARGTPQEIFHSTNHPYVKSLLAAVPSRQTTARPVTDQRTHIQPAIEASELSKGYRSLRGKVATPVVSHISFVLPQGKTLGLIGESGAGKSTIARLLTGMEPPDSGWVNIFGTAWSTLSESQRRSQRWLIQMVYQDPLSSFDPRMKAGEIITDALKAAGVRDKDEKLRRAHQLLAQVELPVSVFTQSPVNLSGGQRQRLAIARALATSPKILICDEPVSALDAITQAKILALLMKLQSEFGLSILFISHDLAVISQICDDIMVLHQGQVVEYDTADNVINRPQHQYTKELLS